MRAVYLGRRSALRNEGGTRVDAPINHADLARLRWACVISKCPTGCLNTFAPRLQSRYAVEDPDSAYLQLVVPTGHGDSIDRPWRGVRRETTEHVALKASRMLYNLNDDPYEQANLAFNTRYRSERHRLHERLPRLMIRAMCFNCPNCRGAA